MNAKVKIKLDTDSIKHISIFESMTGAFVKDCIIGEDRVLYVVKPGQAGLAIGKYGNNIKQLSRSIKKEVEIVEFSNNLNKFLNNLFRPMLVNNLVRVERNGKVAIRINLVNNNSQASKPNLTINSRLKKAKFFVKKYFGIDELLLG